MNPFLKKVIFIVKYMAVIQVVVLIFVHFLFNGVATNEPSRVVDVQSGDVVTITSDSNLVTVSLYSYVKDAPETNGPTYLRNSKYLLTTQIGLMPGYYEASEEIGPGQYEISGSPAILSVGENSLVSNPGSVKRQNDFISFFKTFGHLMAFVMVLLMSPLLVRDIK